MSRKAYTQKERQELKTKLYNIGVDLYLKHGVQNVKLPQILKEAGISKPFFYAFYPSVSDLILEIIETQTMNIMELVKEIEKDEMKTWREKVQQFIMIVLHYQEHGIYILTPQDEVWVHHHLKKESYEEFKNILITLYTQILKSWEISSELLSPKVLGNQLLSMVLIQNHAETSMPFLFHEQIPETIHMQMELFINHLESLHLQSIQ